VILDIATPRWAVPLLGSNRYKGAYGGRGSGKSHFFAELLVERCLMKRTRAVCVREVQATIADSVRQLLVDKINGLGVGSAFSVPKDREGNIYAPHGGMIVFRGMQAYNADNIKSLEDFDVAWIEEAQTLSQRSLDLLRPTIRKDGSEIWAGWNPRFDSDAIDAFFRGATTHPDAVAVEVNWQDNPWFPAVLRQEMEADYRANPEKAAHIWGGGYEIATEGSYYARLLTDAERQGRLKSGRYRPSMRVTTAWDIGVDDYTAIWFLQEDATTIHVVDFYEVSGEGAPEIVAQALPEIVPDGVVMTDGSVWSNRRRDEALAALGRTAFRYREHRLPHDAKVREWGGGARQRISVLRSLGMSDARVGVAANPADRIEAVRAILPAMHFADTPRVRKGIDRLRKYKRKWNQQLETFTLPLHDENSHAADALGEYAIHCPFATEVKLVEPQLAQDYNVNNSEGDGDWMTV